MKRRINLICASYMTIIICLSGFFGFLLYQQEQVIKEQSQYITVLNEQLGGLAEDYGDLVREYRYAKLYYEAQNKELSDENQRMHSEKVVQADGAELNKAIFYLESARQTHADIADSPLQCLYYHTTPETQREWVRVYEDLIRYVKSQ